MWQYTLFALGVLIVYNYITTGAALLKIQPEVTGFRFYKITLTDTILEIRIRLTNLSTQTITLQGLQFSIYVNNSYMGQSSTPLNNRLGNYGSMEVVLRVRISTSKLLNLLSSYITTAGNNYTLNIRLNGRVAGNGLSYPFPLSFKVEIPTLISLIQKIQDLFDKGDDKTDIVQSGGGSVNDGILV